MSALIPEDRLYTEDHEWAYIEDDIATIGITDFAQNSLGDVTYIELPEAGNYIQQFSEAGVIESFKAVSDLFSPLSGKVTEVNITAVEQPELINRDCYGEGWIYKLSIANKEETDALLSPEDYKKITEG